MHLRTSALSVALLAALATLPGGRTLASIPAEDGTYHGCYQKTVGSLRVIDAATQRCNPGSEVPVTWSQRGPQGPVGATGAQGPVGPMGPQGYSASVSAPDAAGCVRITVVDEFGLPAPGGGSATVCDGQDGATGPQGAQGPRGETGAKGDAGPQGEPGVSVLATQLPAGDAVCPAGGTRFTSASGETHACNGTPATVANLDALANLPCNVGTPYEGKVEISYDLETQAIAMKCLRAVHELTVTTVSQSQEEYACGSHQCNPYNCNPHQCNAYQCNPRQCNPYDCNPHSCWLFLTCYDTCYQTCYDTCFQTCYDTCYQTCPDTCTRPVTYSVESAPQGIACGSPGSTGSCAASYPRGTPVTLIAAGATFSGDCTGTGYCTVVMDGPKSVVVTR
jgi:hypothetical protein